MEYYVYRHIRLDINIPFSVGKGKGPRCFRKSGRNKYWNNIVKKYGYRVEILKYFDNEDEAFAFEKLMIKLYKSFGYCKANFTDGGEGVSGLKHSEESKEKMRGPRPDAIHWMKGKNHTKATKEKISKANKGKTASIETRKKLSKIHIGNTYTLKILHFIVINKDKQTIWSGTNMKQCAAFIGVSHISSISKCLLGKQKTHKGFTFRYVEEL